MSPRIRIAVLLAAGVLVSGITALKDIQPNDEGLMLQAAARIADGQVPYSDFWWFYPPGQPYLLGALQAVFGPSLLAWRIVRVLADAAVALFAYELAARRAGPGLSFAAWAGAILAMAYPSGPHPFPIALALALAALLAFERRPALAGALTGVAAAWRIEFGLALGAGIAFALLIGRPRPGGRPLPRYLLATVVTAVALYLPVVVAAGIGPTWDLLVDYPLTDFRDYQSLPFPLDYDGPLNTGSLSGFFTDSAEPLLLFYLPLALVIGLAGGLAALFAGGERRAPLSLAVAVFSLGTLAYLLVRADLFHTAPLAVMVAVLAAWALAQVRAGGWLRAVAAGVAAFALAYAVVEGLDRRSLVQREDTVALDVPAADGVRVPPRTAAEVERAVRWVDERVPRDSPIYVTGRRSDFATAGFPLFYVLADRRNPTRYDIAAPGVVTAAPVQREIVADLERARPPVVVRWTSPLTAAREPNPSGRSSGVRILDDYLAQRYSPAARFGSLLLLKRRA